MGVGTLRAETQLRPEMRRGCKWCYEWLFNAGYNDQTTRNKGRAEPTHANPLLLLFLLRTSRYECLRGKAKPTSIMATLPIEQRVRVDESRDDSPRKVAKDAVTATDNDGQSDIFCVSLSTRHSYATSNKSFRHSCLITGYHWFTKFLLQATRPPSYLGTRDISSGKNQLGT